MGEAVPFWLWRINFMNSRAQVVGRARKTKRSMAEYFQDNFVVTNSGVEDPLAVRYSIDKLGIDNVMWAIDYPYQPMEPAVRFIEEFECTDAERHALCHGNAERIFHIDPA
jgi:2,3-dihydroxybenzoate decarboxylase/5-carboxyvanillate decarboxylase